MMNDDGDDDDDVFLVGNGAFTAVPIAVHRWPLGPIFIAHSVHRWPLGHGVAEARLYGKEALG